MPDVAGAMQFRVERDFQQGLGSSGQLNTSVTWVAWREKTAKLDPPGRRVAPKGGDETAQHGEIVADGTQQTVTIDQHLPSPFWPAPRSWPTSPLALPLTSYTAQG